MLIDPFVEAIKPYNLDVKTIVDIGSRDLIQSVEFHRAYPKAKLYAIEANPKSYKKCSKIKPNSVELFNFAVLDYDGETTFYEIDQEDNTGGSSIFEPTDKLVANDLCHNVEKIVVPCKRIDTWAKENRIDTIDLAWVDVQGAELPVFKGFGSLLKNVKAIATEAATGTIYYANRKYEPTNYTNLRKFLEDNNFKEILYQQPWPYEADLVFINNDFNNNTNNKK